MKKYKIFLQCVVFILLSSMLYAQQKPYEAYFEVGKPCPDFHFDNVTNWSKKQVSLSDFRGKWLILDFWWTGCHACIEAFPAHNREQKLFQNNVQFLLVGVPSDPPKAVEIMFKRLKKMLNLDLPCAFDSTLFMKARNYEFVHGMPIIIAIDPDGIVRGSLGHAIKDSDLKKMTLTARPTLRDAFRTQYDDNLKFDPKKPLLVNGNGGNDSSFSYRSIISKWNRSLPTTWFPSAADDSINNPSLGGDFKAFGHTLKELYFFAFTEMEPGNPPNPLSSIYGKFWPNAILEGTKPVMPDSIAMQKYCYELTLPKDRGTRKGMLQQMQRDLESYFGYHARLETRRMPYWKLVVTNPNAVAKLKTKYPNGPINNSSPEMEKPENHFQMYIMKNLDMKLLVSFISATLLNNGNDGPLLDETGINSNIDIDFHFIPSDDESVRKALQKAGFDLLKGERDTQVLVLTN
ncbi:MAG: TlpA disulfide reductase family protein [Bacteroidota bacterium]